MAATIFSVPEGLDAPPFPEYKEGNIDVNGYVAACRAHTEAVKEWCGTHGQGDLAGRFWRYPVADGYAEYVVYKTRPLTLIHLDHMDGYSIPEVVRRGLSASLIREEIRRQESLSALFNRRKETA
jgi:hypothetical protein